MSQGGSPAVAKEIKLPSGWAGLSFEVHGNGDRAVITEVPKACFSSQRFEGAAGGQVEGVEAGDVISEINGHTPCQLAQKIISAGDAVCACKDHEPGSRDKFAATPCISCDFMRRRRSLGINVALQMWLKAVKQDQDILLTVWKKGTEPPEETRLGHRIVDSCASTGVVAIGANSTRKLPAGLDRPLELPLQQGPAQPRSKKQLADAAQQAAAAARRKLDAAVQARQAATGTAQLAATAAAKQATAAAAQALSFAQDALRLAKRRKVDDGVERRLDCDGKAYTLAEFVAQYGGSSENPPLQWVTERRLDYDGQAYTLEDFIQEYGGTCADPPPQWKSASQ